MVQMNSYFLARNLHQGDFYTVETSQRSKAALTESLGRSDSFTKGDVSVSLGGFSVFLKPGNTLNFHCPRLVRIQLSQLNIPNMRSLQQSASPYELSLQFFEAAFLDV